MFGIFTFGIFTFRIFASLGIFTLGIFTFGIVLFGKSSWRPVKSRRPVKSFVQIFLTFAESKIKTNKNFWRAAAVKPFTTVINCSCPSKSQISTCGLYYKHVLIVNDDSSIISKWSFKLIDGARVIIYDRNMFVIQTTGNRLLLWLQISGKGEERMTLANARVNLHSHWQSFGVITTVPILALASLDTATGSRMFSKVVQTWLSLEMYTNCLGSNPIILIVQVCHRILRLLSNWVY